MPALDPSPRLLAGLAIAAAIAVLASCGDGGSGTPPKEFQAEANQVCRDLEQQLVRIQRMVPPTADQAAKQASAVVDVSKQALDNLRQIEPPENLEATYDRYLDAREKAIGFVEDSRDAAAHNDANAYARGKRRLAAGQPTRRQLAIQLGLSACSRVSLQAGGK